MLKTKRNINHEGHEALVFVAFVVKYYTLQVTLFYSDAYIHPGVMKIIKTAHIILFLFLFFYALAITFLSALCVCVFVGMQLFAEGINALYGGGVF